MKPYRLLSVFLLAGCLAILAGCQTGNTSSANDSAAMAPDVEPSNYLRIGVTPDAPPMAFKQQGKLIGFEIELGEKLGDHLNRPVKFVELQWEDQIKSLQSGKIDIVMSSMSITPERSMLAAFSNPYMKVGQMMLVHRSELHRYALGIPQPLPGTVGTQSGTVGEFLIESRFARSKRKSYRTIESAVSALINKRISSVVSDAQIVWYQAALNEANGLAVVPRMLNQDMLGWPVRKQDGALLAEVNAFILQKQNDGTMNEIIRRWMPLAR